MPNGEWSTYRAYLFIALTKPVNEVRKRSFIAPLNRELKGFPAMSLIRSSFVHYGSLH